MYTYKFRLFFDEIEDFVRDYELLADQTFRDFHNIIIESIEGLSREELASFYVCDSNWNKTKEIRLIDMEDADEEFGSRQIPKTTMENAVLSDLIDDPHQLLIYEHDFLNQKTFFIELIKSSESNDELTYPRCTAAVKALPKPVNIPQKDAFDFSDLIEDDDDADKEEDFYSQEDLDSLSNDIEF
jgi:hypothetical protein